MARGALGIFTTALTLGACGGGDKPPAPAATSPAVDTSSSSSYSIKFFVTDKDGKTTEHKAGPHLGVVKQDASSGPGQNPQADASGESARLGSSQQKLSVCTSGTGGTGSETCSEAQTTDTTESADLQLQ
jgi:hypothetical protein